MTEYLQIPKGNETNYLSAFGTETDVFRLQPLKSYMEEDQVIVAIVDNGGSYEIPVITNDADFKKFVNLADPRTKIYYVMSNQKLRDLKEGLPKSKRSNN